MHGSSVCTCAGGTLSTCIQATAFAPADMSIACCLLDMQPHK